MTSPRIITFGTFDLFHIGHVNILRRARQLGGHLTVGVSTDHLNFSKKGRYPIFPEADRLAIVAAMRDVDEVFLEASLELKREYLLQYRADILVMGDDWAGHFDEFKDICRVVYLDRTKGISSTELKQTLSSGTTPNAPLQPPTKANVGGIEPSVSSTSGGAGIRNC